MPELIVTLSEKSLKTDLRKPMGRNVEEMLNGLLDEEAGDLVGAERFWRAARREAYRTGHYERKLATTPPRRGGDSHARAQGDEVHLRDHRALPQARDEHRGGDDRDAPRRRLHQADRGRLGDHLGGRASPPLPSPI